jgi:hypothetical protein
MRITHEGIRAAVQPLEEIEDTLHDLASDQPHSLHLKIK